MYTVISVIVVMMSTMCVRRVRDIESGLLLMLIYILVGVLSKESGKGSLGIILVIVYVGAVSVMICYVIMIIGGRSVEGVSNGTRSFVVDCILCVIVCVVILSVEIELLSVEELCMEETESLLMIGEMMFNEGMEIVIGVGCLLLISLIVSVRIGGKVSNS